MRQNVGALAAMNTRNIQTNGSWFWTHLAIKNSPSVHYGHEGNKCSSHRNIWNSTKTIRNLIGRFFNNVWIFHFHMMSILFIFIDHRSPSSYPLLSSIVQKHQIHEIQYATVVTSLFPRPIRIITEKNEEKEIEWTLKCFEKKVHRIAWGPHSHSNKCHQKYYLE